MNSTPQGGPMNALELRIQLMQLHAERALVPDLDDQIAAVHRIRGRGGNRDRNPAGGALRPRSDEERTPRFLLHHQHAADECAAASRPGGASRARCGTAPPPPPASPAVTPCGGTWRPPTRRRPWSCSRASWPAGPIQSRSEMCRSHEHPTHLQSRSPSHPPLPSFAPPPSSSREASTPFSFAELIASR